MKELTGWFFEACREKKFAGFHISTLIFSAVFMSGCEQMRVDAQMEELCKKDGGGEIYEKIFLPQEMFTKNGDPNFLGKWDANGRYGNGYRITLNVNKIHEGKPTLTKYRYQVVRDSDRKILGVYVWYQRIGGDFFPRLGPDSSRTCPKNASEVLFLRKIFIPKN